MGYYDDNDSAEGLAFLIILAVIVAPVAFVGDLGLILLRWVESLKGFESPLIVIVLSWCIPAFLFGKFLMFAYDYLAYHVGRHWLISLFLVYSFGIAGSYQVVKYFGDEARVSILVVKACDNIYEFMMSKPGDVNKENDNS